jgi:hypothetical protein
MKAVHILSLIARLALMVTLVLGLLLWIAQISYLRILLNILMQISFTNIHVLISTIGTIFLLALGAVTVWTRGIRMLAAGSMLYALLLPALGMTQSLILVGNLHWLIQAVHLLIGIGAMYLALGLEKRYQRLSLEENSRAKPEAIAI